MLLMMMMMTTTTAYICIHVYGWIRQDREQSTEREEARETERERERKRRKKTTSVACAHIRIIIIKPFDVVEKRRKIRALRKRT